MKKLIFSICGAALLLSTACTKQNDATTDYSAQEIALGDSVATNIGQLWGARSKMREAQALPQWPEYVRNNYKQEEYLKGVMTILSTDTANIAFLQGIQTGFQMLDQVYGKSKRYDVPVSMDKVIAAFKESYKVDSVNQSDIEAYQSTEYSLDMRLRERLERRRQEKAEANIKAGKEYIESVLAKGYEQTEKGLVYKINNPGEETKVQPSDMIKLRYKGMHTDGTVFDQTEDEAISVMANQFIPGFNEALTLVGKGGYITAVIPAELAYGERDLGEIGPNEVLVFDIWVDDITTPQE